MRSTIARRIAVIATGVAAIAATLVVYRFDPSSHAFFPRCVFHQVTGLQCPGCGATRALYALLHGDVARAFWFNPLFLLFLPVLILGGWSELRGRVVQLAPAAEDQDG